MRTTTLFALALLTACGGSDPAADDETSTGSGTELGAPDADGDGLSDDDEIAAGLDPNSADSDGDGLEDGEEEGHGTDPLVADTDDDRLLDGDEILEGTDPLLDDTDGDGYYDGDEVAEKSDPLDADDWIYKGGWPYNYEKDDMNAPDFNTAFAVGEKMPQFKGFDQFGQMVKLYDFGKQGNKIVVDISAAWCGPCNDLSYWLDYGDATYDSWYPGVREAVNNGDLYWVTVLGDDYSGPAGKSTVKNWFDLYPNASIPVIEDGDYDLVNHIQLPWWPSVFALSPQMKVLSTPDQDWAAVLDL